ncbi:MAG: FG-GAP-like repeat-containing protein [candidate division WOR-3 bacterium]
MKRIAVFMFLFIITVIAQLLQIDVTDEASEVPTVNQIQKVNSVGIIASSEELPYLPGWPVKTTSYPTFAPARGIALADFDGDGKLEVIRPTTMNQIYVWRFDGTLYPGWPRTLNNAGQYAAAVADVDLDGDYEICVNTRGLTSGGKVYLFDENGNNKPGWPFTGPHNGNFAESPCLADVNGDDTLEIIVGERDWPIGHLHVLRYDGTEFSSAWPCSLDHVPTGTAAVADINLDGVKEIIYYSYNSLYVFDPNGRILEGWPQTTPNGRHFSYQSAALADVDGDDTLEIITAMHQNGGGVYVWRHNGILMNGWPFDFSRWTYCPPTIADLYRNHDLKIICGLSGIVGGAADVLYAFDDNASVLNGFPIFQPNGDAAEGNITVADIDGDGDMEIIFSSNLMTTADTAGYLYAVHHDGTPVAGWPLRTFGFTYLNGATVADVDGDDSMDIIAVSAYESEMQVSIWEAGVPFSRMSWEWQTYHFDMARTGLYRPAQVGIFEKKSERVFRNLKIAPNPIKPGSNLKFYLKEAERIEIDLYDKTGSLVKNLFAGNLTKGEHKLVLPSQLASGVYFIRFKINNTTISSKLILTR